MNIEMATPRTAIVTGSSRGLGLAVTRSLVASGWHVVVDARDGDRLRAELADLPSGSVTVVPGDVADASHRAALADAAVTRGDVALLVNNASVLAGSPQPRLAALDAEAFARVLAVNTIAPADMVRRCVQQLTRSRGAVINISSDAAVEPYDGWAAYGASKAALDLVSAVLAVEHPELGVYALDPGDMATDLHQQAFPDEDVSDRPSPRTVVPALLHLVTVRPPSGRYRATELLAPDLGVEAGDAEGDRVVAGAR